VKNAEKDPMALGQRTQGNKHKRQAQNPSGAKTKKEVRGEKKKRQRPDNAAPNKHPGSVAQLPDGLPGVRNKEVTREKSRAVEIRRRYRSLGCKKKNLDANPKRAHPNGKERELKRQGKRDTGKEGQSQSARRIEISSWPKRHG